MLLSKGKEMLQKMLETKTRAEVLQLLPVTAGAKKGGSRSSRVLKVSQVLKAAGFAAKMKKKLQQKKAGGTEDKKKLKPSLKKKPSLKLKPSALKKKEKKAAQKKEKGKTKKTAAQKGKTKKKGLGAMLKKAETTAKKKAAAKEELVSVGEVMVELEKENAVDAWQDAVKILVASEKAGIFSYGKEGLVQPADWKAEEPEVAVNLQPGVHSLPRVCLKELQPWKKAAKIKPFTALSRAAVQRMMNRCGLQSLEDEEGDKVQLHNGSGDWLLDQHIDLGWELMKWGLALEMDAVQMVAPNLLQSFMEIAGAWSSEASAADTEKAAMQQSNRRKHLQKLMQAELCFLPIYCSSHWTLLTVKNGKDGLKVEYRDSLKPSSTTSRSKAAACLKELLPEAEFPSNQGLENAATQPAGSAKCGTYVLQWMEQSCREWSGEKPTSLGWPDWRRWSKLLQTLCSLL